MYRESERRRKEIAKLRNKIRKMTNAAVVTGGGEYVYYTGDNYEGVKIPFGIILDKNEVTASAVVHIGFNMVEQYISDSGASIENDLKDKIAKALRVSIESMLRERRVIASRSENILRIISEANTKIEALTIPTTNLG